MPDATPTEELRVRAAVALHKQGPLLREIGGLFAEAGHELYLVGGSVRDAVLGRLTTDLDFTTDARPAAGAAASSGRGPTRCGTPVSNTAPSGAGKAGLRLEITTFRADSYDQVSRNPQVRFGDSPRTTIWCAATSPSMRWPCGSPPTGRGSSSTRWTAWRRCGTGSSTPRHSRQMSFGDDPLRMLRAARFVSQLEFGVADRVREAIVAMAPQLGRITVERVAVELDKMLLGADPVAGIELMVQTGMGDVVLPEIGAMQMAIDEHHQHKDVYQHSLTVLRQAMELESGDGGGDSGDSGGPDLVLRWAALLHDIGKPATRRHEADGGVSFHHHEVVGAKMVRKRMRALKYSKQMVDDVSQLVYLHLRFHGYGDGKWTDSAVRRYVADAGPLLPRLHKLVRADCTTRNKRRAAAAAGQLRRSGARIAELAAKEDLDRVRPDLDGNAIMAAPRHPGRAAGGRGVELPQGAAAGSRTAVGAMRPQPNYWRGGTNGVAPPSNRAWITAWMPETERRRSGPASRHRPDGDGISTATVSIRGDGLRRRAADDDGTADHADLDLDDDGRPEARYTDDGSGAWTVAGGAAAGPLRWFGLDGVEHTGADTGPTSMVTGWLTGCWTWTATVWPIGH